VGRIYAGILGPLAFLISLARGWIDGSPPQSSLWTAWWSLLLFAALGYVIGRLAEWIIGESVASRIAAELEAQRAAEAAAEGTAERHSPGGL
jgi:hypothetical protein